MGKGLERRFICDEMLKRLARWLRIMGHDVIDPDVDSDRELIDLAISDNRTILTRDKNLSNSRYVEALRILSDDLDNQLEEVLRAFPLEVFPPGPTRCPSCNGLLEGLHTNLLDEGWARQRSIPRDVISLYDTIYICTSCDKVYWTGSHWEDITARLDRFGLIPMLPN